MPDPPDSQSPLRDSDVAPPTHPFGWAERLSYAASPKAEAWSQRRGRYACVRGPVDGATAGSGRRQMTDYRGDRNPLPAGETTDYAKAGCRRGGVVQDQRSWWTGVPD